METELLRYSRAGDVFHYRWAARRCLKMIYPKSRLRQIVIEGSKDRKLAGEYVIDVAEYSDSTEGDSLEIAYYQLKHTTVRKEQPFNLSDLKDTIEGFAERYSEHFCRESKTHDTPTVTFSIVTNRPIAENFKRKILKIRKGGTVDERFQITLEKYTNLKGEHLNAFCASLEFADGEGDYDAQRYKLHAEISRLLAGTVDDPQIDSITALVQEKALPKSDGIIIREDIYRRFGVTSERDLYPAPPEIEELDNPISREQHHLLLDCILNSSTPVIIHAAGGVGKSVFAHQITHLLPVGSLGIVYDCFGGGRYRNRSEPRHRHRDALIQISNELASYGICDPLITQSTTLEDAITRKFLARLSTAAKTLRNANENAILVILIDAADNAEMAAEEFGQTCFVHELLRESIPDICRLVALCRTERIHLLQPSSAIPQLELEPFSQKETLIHLRRHFPEATKADGLEFYRLTNNGNPRVQANALSTGLETIVETLDSLGPSGSTVEEQIEAQIDSAILAVKETFPGDYQSNIDAICLGLANLPPLIPVSVLATAAEVDEATVKSFVADLGHHLWLSDTSVQFRDEPTETWFREKFSATAEQIASFIIRLKPLANKYPYVAMTLPSLLLQAERYDELIDLALSDDLLPKDNPIDERNIRVYRLQFAFRAALKLKWYVDATKLALRAGEEVAGDKRQIELLTKNVDLIAPLQDKQRVQELAFRLMLRSGWDGSENVYSAALLSSVEDFKGEARGYLRAANNWLQLYFDEREKSKENFYQDTLKDDDIVELAFANFGLFGANELINFILKWRPPEVIYRIAKQFIKRLIDASNFDAIEEISQLDFRSHYLGNQYLMIAIAHELLEVGRFPRSEEMELCLTLLTTGRTRIPKPVYSYKDTTASALLSFIESCAARGLSKAKILRALRYYVPIKASRSVSSNFPEGERDTYLRAVALRCIFANNLEPNLDELLPKEFVGEKTHRHEQDVREFKQIVGGLLPWYIVRARVLVNDIDDIFEAIKYADQRSKSASKRRWRDSDTIPYEISRIRIEILTLYRSADANKVEKFFSDHLKKNQQIWIQDRLKAVRGAFRLDHLSGIRRQLEQSAYEVVDSASSEGPETRAEWYIDLARAVLPVSRGDAAAYFDYAIEAVSKFGDELVQRWEAVAALADRSAEGGHTSPEMAYRFIRCAELVGDNVAREKHFGRNEAVRICARLSPVSALAALSRWRDRDIGWFDRQLPALADEIVSSNFLSPSVGWSLSAFFEGYGLDDFASLCIERESSTSHHQYILDTAIRDLRLNEASETSWQKLKHIAQQYSIESGELDDVLSFYAENPEKESEETPFRISHSSYQDEAELVDWEKTFNDLELTTSSGISQAISRFDAASNKYRNHETFWQEVLTRINESEAYKFLIAVANAEKADRYDIQRALRCFPDDWRGKVSIKKNWTIFLKVVARRFASELTNRYTLDNFCKSLRIDSNMMPFIREGIIEGLSENTNLTDASTFFGFAETVSNLLSSLQATDLLDFGLTRFELHIDDAYADGCWSSWLTPPDNMSKAFAGFVWSALGSPRAETRWRAAHCVRRLAEIGCEREIDALIQWMERDSVDAFGSHKFPFYNLHARQYLLIALARASIDNPQILRRYHAIFLQHALAAISHILIQKYSAEIALNIEKAYPNTYSEDGVEQLHRVGVSQLPIKEMDSFSDKLETYWHIKGEVDTSLEFYHGWDFDRYWFEPLGDVFGISGKQVEELATEVVINKWCVETDGSFQSDSRARLWRSSRNEREIWHDHGSYPRVDNYSFYISYHAMFVVAAKLLQKMPVVRRRDWYEDEWAEWLHRHLLTRNDGRWLADRRDPAPLLQRDWIHQTKTKKWHADIKPIDFIDVILFKRKRETWLHVFGSWEEGDSEREESINVSTALVSPAASQSLLNALTTCPDPHDFKLPEYQEERMEFKSYPFVLKGWVWRDYTDNRLDEYDPHAGQIAFPPCQVKQSIVEKLGLSVDSEQREWFLPNTDTASILCELWSTNKPRPDEDPLRRGERLSASLAFLKNLCSILECELIFEVQINRRFMRKSYMRNEDGIGYTPPRSKIYILSADGKLRDTKTHYQLR